MSGRVTFGPAGVKRRPVSGRRPVSFHLVLSEAERDELRAKAAAAQVTMGRYLVEKALTGQEPADRRAVAAEVATIRLQLVGMARNLNQIAIVANTTGEAPAFRDVAATVLRSIEHLDAFTRRGR